MERVGVITCGEGGGYNVWRGWGVITTVDEPSPPRLSTIIVFLVDCIYLLGVSVVSV